MEGYPIDGRIENSVFSFHANKKNVKINMIFNKSIILA